MKKKSLILLVVLLALTLFVTGCNKKEETNANKNSSIAESLTEQFLKESKDSTDIKKISDSISKNKKIEVAVESREVEDYMPGFKAEIKNYKKAYTISPMIGSIPFVAYVFESDDADKLIEELELNADKRWNICTEADEVKIEKQDNIVFIVMAPKSFEE